MSIHIRKGHIRHSGSFCGILLTHVPHSPLDSMRWIGRNTEKGSSLTEKSGIISSVLICLLFDWWVHLLAQSSDLRWPNMAQFGSLAEEVAGNRHCLWKCSRATGRREDVTPVIMNPHLWWWYYSIHNSKASWLHHLLKVFLLNIVGLGIKFPIYAHEQWGANSNSRHKLALNKMFHHR